MDASPSPHRATHSAAEPGFAEDRVSRGVLGAASTVGCDAAPAVRRTLDPAFLNQVANHPDVRPWLGGEGPLDLSGLVSDPANIALVTDHGGWVLTRHEPARYELHTLFLPEGRGRGYFAAARQALDYIFTASDAREIVTKVPVDNRPAAFVAKLVGFAEIARREAAWKTPDGGLCALSCQELSVDAWAAANPSLADLGRWFHERLETAKAASGSALGAHADDEGHDRAVGAAVAMIRAGNPMKAVWFYNRVARLAGYATIALISEHPVVVDVRDAVVEVRGDDMEVLLCR